MIEKEHNIDALVDTLKSLSDKERDIIFERVFLNEDTTPLTAQERKALNIAEEELKAGETIRWPFGE